MKKLMLSLVAIVSLSGCMMPNYSRLIPENKDAHLMIYNPIYGWAVIDTRVQHSSNSLPALPVPVVVPTPPPAKPEQFQWAPMPSSQQFITQPTSNP